MSDERLEAILSAPRIADAYPATAVILVILVACVVAAGQHCPVCTELARNAPLSSMPVAVVALASVHLHNATSVRASAPLAPTGIADRISQA